VKKQKYIVYSMVYLLVKLALILLVAALIVERCFFAMNFAKNRMKNHMRDGWLNDCLIIYIERDIFGGIDNEKIIKYFQSMKIHKGQL